MSAWTHIATKCAEQNKEFMECKKRDRDPAACIPCGEKVITCVSSVLKELDQRCPEEFAAYSKCMHYYHNKFEECRPEQTTFEKSCTSMF